MLFFFLTRTLLLVSLHKNGSTHPRKISIFFFTVLGFFSPYSLTSPNWSFERLDSGKRKIWKEYLNIVLSLANRWGKSWEKVMRVGTGKEKKWLKGKKKKFLLFWKLISGDKINIFTFPKISYEISCQHWWTCSFPGQVGGARGQKTPHTGEQSAVIRQL